MEKVRNIKERHAAITWNNEDPGINEEHASRIFANSPKQAEAYAISQAITDLQWRCSELIIKTNSIQMVQVLHHEDRCNKNIGSIVKVIKKEANSFQFACIKFKWDEVNLAII